MEDGLSRLLGLPDVEIVEFERTPLVQVLCQIRYPLVLRVQDSKVVDGFQRAVKARYPVMQPGGNLNLQFNVGAGAASFQQGPLWNFTDREGFWKVVLAQDFLALETRAYHTFDDFLARFREVLVALMKHIDPPVVSRIGLRYVNEIRGFEEDWRQAIRAGLLGPMAIPELYQHAVHSVQQVVLQFPENQGLTIHHGLVPSGTTVPTVPDRNQPGGPFYLLDFDASKEFALPRGLQVASKEIIEYLVDYNKAVYKAFRWSLTDDYLSSLGVRTRHES